MANPSVSKSTAAVATKNVVNEKNAMADKHNPNEQVRVYEVVDSLLQLTNEGDPFLQPENTRRRGDTVTNFDFNPSSLEQRYLEVKPTAIRLVQKTTWAEYMKDEAAKKEEAPKE